MVRCAQFADLTSYRCATRADRQSSLTALTEALENLDQLAIAVNEQYRNSLRKGAFERFEEE